MDPFFTEEQLNNMSRENMMEVMRIMQNQVRKKETEVQLLKDKQKELEFMNAMLSDRLALAQRRRFGSSSEKYADGYEQMDLFNEAEANADTDAAEIEEEIVIPSHKRKKRTGKKEEDLSNFEVTETIEYKLTGEDRYCPDCGTKYKVVTKEVVKRLKFIPSTFEVEEEVTYVYSCPKCGAMIRPDREFPLIKGSIATPSLEAAIINAKYVNSNPLDRISRDFQANGLNLSKQTMSNWMVWTAERYLSPMCDFMRKRQLEAHVNQSDETPVDVIHDGRPAGSKSYMWVHITGELSPVPPIIIYEYQKTRHSDHPKAYYKDFDGILMTDGLEQYHKLERDLDGVKNANCMAHARRHFANAIKAIGKSNPEAVEASVAYKALVRIGAIYDLEGALKELTPEERLKERQASIKPLVEEFFAWLRKIQADRSVLPKSETAKGINYCLNQEAYLKVFLSDGEVPIDNLASERALRTFTIGRKNWMTINTVRGADASAIIYSVTETARANGLNVYYYMKHLLTELTRVVRADGSIDEKDLKPLMPWSKDLPAECYKRRK